MFFLYRDTEGQRGKKHYIFLNKDISITDKDIEMKYQIFYLGLSFMLCYVENIVSKIQKKIPFFFLI